MTDMSSTSDGNDASPDFTPEQLAAALADIRNSVEFTIGSEVLELADSRTPLRERIRGLRPVLSKLRQRRSVTQSTKAHRAIGVPASKKSHGVRVATVLDTFSEHAFASELRVDPIARGQSVRPQDFDYLLVESAWAGTSGSWVRAMNRPTSTAAADLVRLVEDFKQAGRPTIFWNKEDPTGSAVFLEAMRRFDLVFSTDRDSVEQYRSIGFDAHVLELFAATRVFNPGIGSAPRSGVIFPGSLRSEKYPARARQIDFLVGAAAGRGDLTVYARPGAHESDAEWRRRFGGARIATADYTAMPGVYRSSEIVLNVSSVPASPSLVPRRVYEAMACRVPIVSAPSKALQDRFGDVVTVVENAEQAKEAITTIHDDRVRADSMAHRAYRRVHSDHSTTSRIEQIHNRIGLAPTGASAPNLIAIVHLDAGCPDVERWLLHCFDTQQDHVSRVAIASQDEQAMRVATAWMRHRSMQVCAAVPELLATAQSDDVISLLTTSHYYGPDYLSDALIALQWSDADVVGKGCGSMVDTRQSLSEASWRSAFSMNNDVLMSAALMRVATFRADAATDGVDARWSDRQTTGLTTSPYEFVRDGCRSRDWSASDLERRCSANQ